MAIAPVGEDNYKAVAAFSGHKGRAAREKEKLECPELE
jgi:hypothetical protein